MPSAMPTRPVRGWPCCSSTSTTSSASTIRSATWWATRCCAPWPCVSAPACAPPTSSRASVATNSWCCCPAWPPGRRMRAMPKRWRRSCSRPSAHRSTPKAGRCRSRRRSASRCTPATATRPRNLSSTPTPRCTWPRRAAAPTTSTSTVPWSARPTPNWCWKGSWRWPWSAASSSCISSPRCARRAARWSVPRPCCAGTTRSAACSRPTPSSRWPRSAS